MKTIFIEAKGDGGNWGKFMVARFTSEWGFTSAIEREARGLDIPLLKAVGWGPDVIHVVDLQTGEGAFFRPGGLASADLMKHKIWVCPLFEPFLAWLYRQDLRDIQSLPRVIELEHGLELQGYRRPGPKGA
jgi:hypothetical protein